MSKIIETLSKYTSLSGAEIAEACMNRNPFYLKIVSPRKTRLGDYRYNFEQKYHQITINNDLKGDSFLFTLLHEIAHQLAFLKYSRNIEPHGKEWKNEYKNLLLLALEKDAFENPKLIIKGIDNIKSSSVYNKELFRALYTNPTEDECFLDMVQDQKEFIFNAVIYKKIQKNRSRTLCLNVENSRKYLISNQALVMIIED